jgi:hypothetical protein
MYVYFQNELNDDKYVRSSRIYSLANDQLQHWIAELDRYKSLAESLQVNNDLFFSFIIDFFFGCFSLDIFILNTILGWKG